MLKLTAKIRTKLKICNSQILRGLLNRLLMAFKQNGILLKWYLTRAFQISTNLGSHKAGHTGCSYFGGRKVALKQCDQIWPNFTFL